MSVWPFVFFGLLFFLTFCLLALFFGHLSFGHLSFGHMSSTKSTGFSPNFLMLGTEVRALIDLIYGVPEQEEELYDSYDRFVDEKMRVMRESYTLVRQHLSKCAERNKGRYDMQVQPAKFEVNQWVWVYSPRRYQGRSPK